MNAPRTLGFDLLFSRALRIVGLAITVWAVFIDRMEHPEALLVAGPMMGIANLLKGGAE